MIKYIKGDVFKTSAQIIAHGCNCKGGFGAGIAATVAKIYPKAKDRYLDKYKNEGWQLGEVQMVQVKPGLYIANCATQKDYGSPRSGKVFADYKAIEMVMQQLKSISIEHNLQVAMPKIGAGLAGGDWKKIEKIINDVFQNTEVWVYEL